MSDLISRAEAKEALRERFKRIPTYAIWAMHIIDELPTHPTPSNTLGALDCVERAEVIKVVKFYETFCDPYPRVIEALEKLPSVQPEIIRCKDCKWYGRADKRRFYRGMDCLQKRIDTIVPDKDFCSRAERRTDERY